jgi:hypothetical protein
MVPENWARNLETEKLKAQILKTSKLALLH